MEWYPADCLLLELVFAGLWVACIGTVLVIGGGGVSTLFPELIQALVAGLADLEGSVGSAGAGAAGEHSERAEMIEILGYLIPGLSVGSWMIMVVVNGVLAQMLALRWGRLGRPPVDFTRVSLPEWLGHLFCLTVALAVLAEGAIGLLAANLVLVLAIPFFFVGLSVVHGMIAGDRIGNPVLFLLYMALFLFGWPAVLVIGLGVAEPWVGLRRRLAAEERKEF
jgi:hypothetical protein